jgi:hypothetical protein
VSPAEPDPDDQAIADRIAQAVEDIGDATLQDRVYAAWITAAHQVLQQLTAESPEAASFVRKLNRKEQINMHNDEGLRHTLADAFGELPQWQQDALAEHEAAARRHTPETRAWVDEVRSDASWRHIEHRGYLNVDPDERARYDGTAAEHRTRTGHGAPRDIHAEQVLDEELEQAQRQLDNAQKNASFFARVEQQGYGRR